MDVRDAGWKLAVVDVNLFPAGFNNLTADSRKLASEKVREFLSAKLLKTAPWKIAVVPEAHTQNQGYLENLSSLLDLLTGAGCEIRLLWPGPPLPKPWKLVTASGKTLEYLPAEQALSGADALILNHDLSGGVPAVIANVNLPTFPSARLGWYRRRKSDHQRIVDGILVKLARSFDFFDPWYFSTQSSIIPSVDFESDSGLHHLATQTEAMLKSIQYEYQARGITEIPHVFVKNDAGTYGMGILSVSHAEQLIENAKQVRKKMKKGKESVPVSQVILQEGVPTVLVYEDASKNLVVAEPSLYLVNGLPIGGFLRIHEKLGANARFENLNQPGAVLEALNCDLAEGSQRPFKKPRGQSPCQQIEAFDTYGFLARLHVIAAGLEDCPK